MATAYHMKKRMARGGEAQKPQDRGMQNTEDSYSGYSNPDDRKRMAQAADKASGYAKGGKVEDHTHDDMVDRIMCSKGSCCYSEGGMVANEKGEGADPLPAEFDDLALRDTLESDYDGTNAGDHLGNAKKDEDERDIVARIMKSRAKKDKLPRPA